MDTISDFLTVIRNAVASQLPTCCVMASRMRVGILKILRAAGYIENFKQTKNGAGLPMLEIELRYVEGVSPIVGIVRCSRPGRRLYYNSQELPRVLGGLGIAIISTSRGILKDSEARKMGVGGELLCKVW